MEQIISATPEIKLPSAFDILKEALVVFKNRWRVFFKLVLATYGAMFGIFFISIFFTMAIIFLTGPLNNKAVTFASVSAILAVMVCFAMIFNSWIYVAMITVMRDFQENIDFSEALKRSRPFIFSYLWLNIIIFLTVLPGFALFIIPGLILSVWFFFAQFVLIAGKRKGIDALLLSREYSRGLFKKILGFCLLLVAVSLIVNFVIELVPGTYILKAVCNFIMAPFGTIYCYLAFDHIKKFKANNIKIPTDGQKKMLLFMAIAGASLAAFMIGSIIYFAPQIKAEADNPNSEVGKFIQEMKDESAKQQLKQTRNSI